MTERMTPDKALAAVEHRFIEFSEDFATWVVFRGPPGGES